MLPLEALTEIDKSNDSDKLGGETSQDLLNRFLERAMEHIPGQTGYRKLFKVLRLDRPSYIEHNLGACPLIDLYALAPFDAVCAVDEDKTARLTQDDEGVKFYLYHTSEKKLRHPEGGDNESIVIEETDGPIFRTPWSKMLDMLEVEYTASSSLGDLETEFWTSMFSDPNDQFDSKIAGYGPVEGGVPHAAKRGIAVAAGIHGHRAFHAGTARGPNTSDLA